jgi:predicted TIM-barrel fold metal-dependent hydrolase
VFGDPERFPVHPGSLYGPQPAASFETLRALHRVLGIERGVLVQAGGYATDHRVLLEALSRGSGYVGIALVDDSVGDADLERLHAAGVRGARFNFSWGIAPVDHAVFLRTVDRIHELGWHARIHAMPHDLEALTELLGKARVPLVIDHLAHLDPALGVDHPAVRVVVDAIRRHGWWIMLSNGDLHSKTGPPWHDAVPIAQALIAAAPERAIWGSDWPHFRPLGHDPLDDAALLELLYAYAPADATRRAILVDNPATLFGRGSG